MQNSDNTTKSARPNLLSGLDASAADNASILNTLDATKKTSAKNSQKGASHLFRNSVLIGMLLIIGIGFAFYTNKTDSADNEPETRTASLQAISDDEKTSSSPATQTEPQTAVIENDLDASSTQDASKDPNTKLTESLEAGLPVSGNSLKTALENPKKNNEKPVKSVNAERTPEKRAVTLSNTKRSDEAKASDRDVNILTALVGDGKPAINTKNTQSTKEKSTNKQNTKQTKAAKHEDDGPDIVERKPGDSTAGLLMRCKKLGFIEGELCRWRICSGRWDTDAACKPQPPAQ